MHEQQADRDDHDAQHGARSFGRITPWWMPSPPTNETASVNDERRPVRPAVVRRQRPGMYVENIAISPCAKLMTPVARWMSTSASASEP